MLGNTAATIDYDMNQGSIRNEMPNGPDVSVLPNLPLIPKKEPIDWNVSFEDTTAFENPVNTIIPFTTPYKIKDPIIVLERCDKFLEVANLEKSREKEQLFEACNLSQIVVKSVQGGVKDAGIEWDEPEEFVPNSQNASSTSYIKYQPVLESINNVLPSFRLAVKDKQELFSCLICGQTYVKPYELKAHRRERHGEKKIKRSIKKPLSSTSYQKTAVKATQSSKASINNNGTKKKDAVEDILSKGIGKEDSVVPNLFKVGAEKVKNIPTQSETQKSGELKIVETEKEQSYLATTEEGTGMQTDKENSVICTLCRNRVTNLKFHLEDYHKICCTDILLAELKKCFSITEMSDNQRSLSKKGDKEEVLPQQSTGSFHEKEDKDKVLPEQSTGSWPEKEDKEEVVPQQSTGSLPEKEDKEEVLPEQSTGSLNNNDNELTKNTFSDTGLNHINAAEEILRYKRKRNSTLSIGQYRKRMRLHEPDADSANSDNDIPRSHTYKCDICLGVYDKPSTFHRHTYKHYIRGETKENFHTFRNVYKNSPLYCRPIKDRTKVTEGTNNGEANNVRETRSMKERRHTTAICTSKNSSGDVKSTERFTCTCGRSFRFAYNLFIHRNHVKCGESKMTTSNDAQKENTTHTDSSAGISLTIKKKDHLYEVINTNNVDKGNTENIREFKSDDMTINLLDINHPHSTDDAIIIDEVHKYSKDHIILKLESGEEDSVVNIEDDSDFETSSKCSGKQSTVQSTTKRRTGKTDDITDRMKELETNKVAFESANGVLTRTKVSNIAAKPEAIENSTIVCTCNKKFVSFMSLHRHVIQTHPLLLTCGYCKIKLHSLDAYQSHVCQVVGKPFDLSTNYISCYRCNTLTKSFKEFDQHNAIKHPSCAGEYKCNICYKSFLTSQARQSHIDRCHDTHRCTICGSAVRGSLMRIHEGYHHGFGIPCHPCKKAFLTVKRFDKHMIRVHQKCMPSTVTKRALLPNLIPSIAPSGPENCGICNETFDDERSLRFHILAIHEASYPWFKCQECHMFAATKRALQHHIEIKSCARIRRKTTNF